MSTKNQTIISNSSKRFSSKKTETSTEQKPLVQDYYQKPTVKKDHFYFNRNKYSDDEIQTVKTLVNEILKVSETDYMVVDHSKDYEICIIYPSFTGRSSNSNLCGLILDLKNKEICCPNFPYTKEYIIEDTSDETLATKTDSNFFYLYSKEGSVLRWWFLERENKWFLSTCKKIDSRNTGWAGTMFGILFEKLYASSKGSIENGPDFPLSRNEVYLFLLSDPKNRLVSKIEKETVTYLNSFTRAEDGRWNYKLHPSDEVRRILSDKKVQFQTEAVLENSNLRKAITNSSTEEFSGLFVLEVKDNILVGAIKLVRREYQKLRTIRGDEPDVKKRYLELFNSSVDYTKANELEILFKERRNDFYNARTEYKEAIETLKNVYRKKYIEHDQKFKFLHSSVYFPVNQAYLCYRSIPFSMHKERKEFDQGRIIMECVNRYTVIQLLNLIEECKKIKF